MKAPRFVVMLAASCAVGGLTGLAINRADAAPVSPARALQALSNQAADWLTAHGIPTKHQPTVFRDLTDAPPLQAAETGSVIGQHFPDHIEITTDYRAYTFDVWRAKGVWGRRHELSAVMPQPLAHLLIHELLHQHSLNEGLVDSVAQDLTPALAAHWAGWRGPSPGFYKHEITAVNLLTAKFCKQDAESSCARWVRVRMLLDGV